MTGVAGADTPRNQAMFQTLIVEDNANFRHTLSEWLGTRFPYMAIAEASNGHEALAEFTRLMPQLVFMDIRLPDSNGINLTRQIRSANLNVVVVVLTAYDIPEYSAASFQAGANYFLCKTTSNGAEIASLVDSVFQGSFSTPPAATGGVH
jgi:DNA-binding NarL/FixJ family response regulator